MKNLILLTLFSLSVYAANAQSQETNPKDTTIYTKVDTPPTYADGFEALAKFVRSNIKPGTDKGMVIASFIIEKNGSVSNIRAIRSPSAAAGKETVRLISSFPKWQPAIKDGKIVRCSFTMPIRFPEGV